MNAGKIIRGHYEYSHSMRVQIYVSYTKLDYVVTREIPTYIDQQIFLKMRILSCLFTFGYD